MNPLNLKLEAFTRLSPDDREQLQTLLRRGTREVAARRDLIREGDSPRFLFVVLSGWACRYKTLPDGRRQIVSFFIAGDLCDLNVFILKEMDHSVAAITKLKVAEVGRDDFETLMLANSRVTQALFWNELVAAAIQREWTLNVGQRTAYERISHLLCEMYLRLRTVGMADENSCDWPLTQTDIADATGLTPVHVNRTLQELRRCGLIELQNRRLVIPDLAALREAALFNDNYLHLDREGSHLDAND